jgi:hypothetical protein
MINSPARRVALLRNARLDLSAGFEHNRIGHRPRPRPAFQALLHLAGLEIMRCPRAGSIGFSTDAAAMQVIAVVAARGCKMLRAGWRLVPAASICNAGCGSNAVVLA